MLHRKILSSPQAKSRDLGAVKASVTSDRGIRTKIHQEIRRIFNSKIESSTDKDGTMILSAAIPSSRRPANQPGAFAQFPFELSRTPARVAGEGPHPAQTVPSATREAAATYPGQVITERHPNAPLSPQ